MAVGEDPRAQSEDVVADVTDHAVDVLDRVLQACADRRVVGERRRALQRHPDGEQRLHGAVVELRRDPFAFVEQLEAAELLLRLFDVVPQTRVLDRDTRLGREHHQRRLVVLGELLTVLRVGQVDVAEHPPERPDGRAEE